jgi:DNA-binding NarL/FixJ family response regulator
MSIPTPAHILVIDEIPLISIGLRQVFESIHPDTRLEHTSSVFTALSAPAFESVPWYLIVLDLDAGAQPGSFLLPAAELKTKFPSSRLMIYSSIYDPSIIEKMPAIGIDAYVHKYESADEIRIAFLHLTGGQPYLSGIFRTLYYDYR